MNRLYSRMYVGNLSFHCIHSCPDIVLKVVLNILLHNHKSRNHVFDILSIAMDKYDLHNSIEMIPTFVGAI